LTTRLQHTDSDAFFQFPRRELLDPFTVLWAALTSPSQARWRGSWKLTTGSATTYAVPHGDWDALIKQVGRWAVALREDLDEPDLWKETLLGEGGTSGAESNAPFTPEEQAEIARQLRAIAESAKERYGLSDHEQAALEGKLRYLEEASARLGRLDWRNLLMGVFLTLISEAILPAETTRHVLQEVVHALAHLYMRRILPELPPGY
jgi:hypothetical protein